jgi:hypothetical protein
MQAWLRKLTSLIAFLTLVSAGACKQEKSPTDGHSPARSIGGGADQSVLAEAIVILLFIAGKQAQDAGECVQDEQRPDRRNGEDRTLKRLLCDPLRDKKQSALLQSKTSGLKIVASPPKE